MDHKSTFKNEDGFTIQELLVALVVGSLLMSFCLSLFLFSDKIFITWHHTCERKDAVNYALQTFVFDIRNSREITNVRDTSLIVQRGDRRPISYFFDKTTIRRNGVFLFHGNVSVFPISMEPSTSGGGKNFVRAISINLSTTSSGINYEVSTEVEVPYSARQNLDNMNFQ